MNSWFTVKVKYTKQLENGQLKRVSEPYLLAAMTFTDAEARIYEELGSLIRGEFNVVGISRTELHDIFAFEDADTWYKAKVVYESQTDDEEKAKKITQQFLIAAHSVKDAYDRLQESLKGMMVDFWVPSIVLSPIVDIFPFGDDDVEAISASVNVAEETIHTPGSKGQVFSASGSDIDDDLEIDSEFIDEIAEDE
jgi:hypothetical protein